MHAELLALHPILATTRCQVSAQYVRCLCLGHEPLYSDLSMIYLIKVYTLSIAFALHLGLACVQSGVYTFMLPQLLLVRFEPEATWTYRFQLLTLQLISLCLLLGASLAMLLWPATSLAAAYYDKLYAPALPEHERRRPPLHARKPRLSRQ